LRFNYLYEISQKLNEMKIEEKLEEN